ncbi:MAG TPA: lysine--tRNA ligase [Gemmataceae bacterium]|nr:lysine--tRNA ligase [Gemmataceae bacterium]
MSDAPDVFEASRADKLRQTKELGLDPWGGRFEGSQPISAIRALPTNQTPRPRVRAAGRIVLRRDMGRSHFLDIRDSTDRIQVHIGQKQIGDSWAFAQLVDLGDLLGVDGEFGATRTGELTIFADKLHPLGKSLLPHPDKHSGMQDVEFRLRHRYLDMIYNPEVLDRIQKRIKIVRCIRNYLDAQGFSEVETPTLHAVAGGAAARPFITHHNALDIDLYLRIALELHLKRLLVGGIEKVYEVGRVFRNEGISPKHNPEFTMLEVYQAYGDYRSMMDLTEGLVVACVESLGQGLQLPYGEHVVDYAPPWQRATYAELFEKHVGVSRFDTEAVRHVAGQAGIATANKHPDVVVHQLFEERVEHKLTGPIFVYDYPASLCPLTKRKRDNPAVAERFEPYVLGMEIGNAYTELNDPVTQEETFRLQLAGLPEEDSMARMDEDFVRALRYGMPPAGGLGIGIDRLVMLLTNTQSIRDVILFPLLRPTAAKD